MAMFSTYYEELTKDLEFAQDCLFYNKIDKRPKGNAQEDKGLRSKSLNDRYKEKIKGTQLRIIKRD